MSSSSSFAQPAAAFISPSLEKYLSTRSPAELEAILNVIQTMCKKGTAQNMPNVKHKVAKPKKLVRLTNTKRPLNSWMAFRAYYSSIFVAQQQKDISGLMTRLWKTDPFHAKWAILAKAYSVIRDYKATMETELDSFLSICCPHIGIVSPEDYLQMLGWEFTSVNGVKTLIRKFAPSVCDFDDQLQNSTLSVEDIISFCHEAGHVDTDNMKLLGGNSSLTMAAPITSSTANMTATAQTSQFNVQTPMSSKASSSAITTPAMSPFTGYTAATNANQPGLGIFKSNIFNGAAIPAHHAGYNGEAMEANLFWSANPTGPFIDNFQGLSSYNQSNFVVALSEEKKQPLDDMYFMPGGSVYGYNQTHTFEPLVEDNFKAFDISHFTEAEFGNSSNVFNEDHFVDFDGNAN